MADNRGALTVLVLTEYLLIWDQVNGLKLQPDIQDQHHWKLSQLGIYSSKSAYAIFFVGSVKFSP